MRSTTRDTENDIHLSLLRSEEFHSAALSSESVDAQVRQAEGGQSSRSDNPR